MASVALSQLVPMLAARWGVGLVATVAALTASTTVAPSAGAAGGVPYEVDTYAIAGSQTFVLTLDAANAAFSPFMARSGGTLGQVEVQLADTTTDAMLEVSITNEPTPFPGGGGFPGTQIAEKTVAVGGLSSAVVDMSFVDRLLVAGKDYTITLDAVQGSVGVPLMSDGAHFEWEPTLGFYERRDGGFDASVMVTGIDDDAPSVSIATGPEDRLGRRGWYIQAPWVSYTCSDPTSGVVDCPEGELLDLDGRHELGATVTDVAAHTSPTANLTVKVDTTDPVVKLTPDRAPNRNGWYRAPVVVSTSATDAMSGVAAVSAPQTYGRTVHASGGASDVAGNLRTRTLLVQVDQRDPSVRLLGVEEGETVTSMPNLRSRASDGTCASCSGVASTYAEAVKIGRHKYAAIATASDYAGNDATDRVVFYIKR